jgi:hypothetical protein
VYTQSQMWPSSLAAITMVVGIYHAADTTEEMGLATISSHNSDRTPPSFTLCTCLPPSQKKRQRDIASCGSKAMHERTANSSRTPLHLCFVRRDFSGRFSFRRAGAADAPNPTSSRRAEAPTRRHGEQESSVQEIFHQMVVQRDGTVMKYRSIAFVNRALYKGG